MQKPGLEIGGHHAIFSFLEINRSNILQKLKKSVCLCFHSLAQKLIYTINIWFNFDLDSFYKQDHLLNVIILGGYAKRWPKYARISKQKLM